ncbi:MAG: Gfo/Idh/MocA family oxidoreductase [Rhodospirillaceae bacterium]|nr:Gfo/Idh/MocA family oxidoreductase [Rhodospirillaceae bacterium]
MKALVVGYGSIGQRHTRLLEELGCETAVVSARDGIYPRRYAALQAGVDAWRPDYVVIANETSAHFGALKTLCDLGFNGRVLVEKPLFDAVQVPPAGRFSHAAVAYNFRCHPLIIRLKRELDGARVFDAHLHVGQWLPDWRPGRDYRASYSARRGAGGGVLRDLSHEIDLALHFFGPWKKLTAHGGHFSTLEIDSEDSFSVLLEASGAPAVQITLNYLDRPGRRSAVINTDKGMLHLDLVRGLLQKDGQMLAEHPVDRDHTYREQHRLMIDGAAGKLCTLAEGASVVELIEAAERANAGATWVKGPAA